jgi:hypothetical protein
MGRLSAFLCSALGCKLSLTYGEPGTVIDTNFPGAFVSV